MKKENKVILIRLFSYIRPFKHELLLAGLFIITSTFIGFLQPLVIEKITDDGMLGGDILVLFKTVTVLAILVTLNQMIEVSQNRLFIKVHNQSYYTIFLQVFQKLLHLKKTYFEDKGNAEILGCLQMDVSQVSSITDRYTVGSITFIFRIVSGLVGLLLISWKLTLIVIAMVPIKVVLVKRFSQKREAGTMRLMESIQDFSRWFGDNLEGIDEIKLWGLFESREKIFRTKQNEILQTTKYNSLIDVWNNFSEAMLEWTVSIMLYLVGGLLVFWGKLSIGAVFAFISYSWYVTGPVSSLLNIRIRYSQILPSAKRLFQFLDMETEEDEGQYQMISSHPRLEFKNVEFFYQGNDLILKDVSFYAEPGEKIAIIGKNGSGKSTILNLLLRFYLPTKGEIYVDHIPISEYTLDKYRSFFSVVSQDPYLFLGNVIDNIDLTGNATKQEVDSAMHASGMDDFVHRNPDVMEGQIGRNGSRLSGGEKQKLAVSRALLKDAPIIILDEATSGFDVKSTSYLHKIILEQMKEKTVILVTHHYEQLKGMDRVYQLENGVLQEFDPNREAVS